MSTLKSAVTCLFRFLAAVFAVLFVVVTLIVLVITNVEQRLFNSYTYKHALAEQNIYERLPTLLAEQFSYSMTYTPCVHNPTRCDVNLYTAGSPELQACLQKALGKSDFEAIGKGERLPTEKEVALITPCIEQFSPSAEQGEKAGGPPDYFKKLTQNDWEIILSDLLPPAWLQTQTESMLDQLFSYLLSEKETFSLNISLVELKKRIAGEEGYNTIMRLARAQPPCTAEQLAALSDFNPETGKGDLPICSPSDAQLAIYTPEVKQGLITLADQLPDEADLTRSTLFGGTGESDHPSPSSSDKSLDEARTVIRIMHQIVSLSWLAPIVLLLLIALFGVNSLRSWLRWWGIPLLFVGVIGVGMTLLGGFGISWVFSIRFTAETLVSPGITHEFAQTIVDFVRSVAYAPLTTIGITAAVIGVVGFGMVLVSFLVGSKGEA